MANVSNDKTGNKVVFNYFDDFCIRTTPATTGSLPGLPVTHTFSCGTGLQAQFLT